MTADLFAAYRPALEEALTRAIDSLSTSHAVLLSHQVETGASREPGLLCLLAADALGAPQGAAEPAAVALLLLDAMAATFEGLDDEGAALSRYGMPRALNAGDGFYALAHSALLHASDAGDAAQRLAAIDLLDATCRAHAEDMRLSATKGQAGSTLRNAAVEFAALAAGVSSASLPDAARAKIDAALQALA
jgi:geranylgeranyl pyrophosphate synthase